MRVEYISMRRPQSDSGDLPSINADRLKEWELAWQEYWNDGGTSTYELPDGSLARHERDFLMHTRTPEHEEARLEQISEEFMRGFGALYGIGPAVTVFGSARLKEDHPYYKQCVEVGRELAKAGFAVMTGGGPGMMEAANRGAREADGMSIGCNIILPHEQQPNQYVDRCVSFHYFFVRKVMLLKYSCAFIMMPGGVGTLDEMFEATTLIQTRKMGPFPIICFGTKFWRSLKSMMKELAVAGTVGEDELNFLQYTDSPKEAVQLIVDALPEPVRACLRPIGG